jgi:hypothetical protein
VSFYNGKTTEWKDNRMERQQNGKMLIIDRDREDLRWRGQKSEKTSRKFILKGHKTSF